MTVEKPSIRHTYSIDWHIARWGRGKVAPAPEFVVIHFTGSGNGWNAADTYKSWLKRPKASRGNTHYIVDSGGIYECVDPKKYSCQYACASKACDDHMKFYEKANGHPSPYACTHLRLAGNVNTINIEACSSKRTPVSGRPNAYMDTDFYFPNETYSNLVALTAWLLDEFGIPLRNLIMHHHISGKLCPAMWCNNDGAFDGWLAFKNDVAAIVNKPTVVEDLPEPSGSGTESGTDVAGTVRVSRGDSIYMSPGGIVVGYFDTDKTLNYTFARDGYYYTDEGYVKGE
jgi:N-acetylmuramoyl-L-alanine amidase CwlA